MSQIRCITRLEDSGLATQTTLILPRLVLDRLNGAEITKGVQEGAAYRDRLLQVLAAMVIQSIDEFRQTDLFTRPLGDKVLERDAELTIEDANNGNKS